MAFGEIMAHVFPILAGLALVALFWADAIETKSERRARANRLFW